MKILTSLVLFIFLLPLASMAAPDDPWVHAVAPVILVASDYKNKQEEIAQAAEHFNSVLRYVQSWYKSQSGTTFTLWPGRIVISPLSSKEWIALSHRAATHATRYVYAEEAKKEAQKLVPMSDHLRYAVSVFAGAGGELTRGATDIGNIAVVPPLSASISCPAFANGGDQRLSAECADSVYALAHELGHAFGLNHSCEAEGFPKDPNCEHSVMGAQRPPGMILLKGEKSILLNNPFFSQTPAP